MTKFIYEEEIKELVNNKKIYLTKEIKDDLKNTRGLALSNGDILINLSANQWKQINESLLIEELSKTILHEHIHIFFLILSKNEIEGEERICQIMSNQIEINGKEK